MKRIIHTYLLLCVSLLCNAQFKVNEQGRPEIVVAGETVLSTPGLAIGLRIGGMPIRTVQFAPENGQSFMAV